MELLAWLEENALSTSVRESRLLYPTILALHSVGMAFLVGLSAAIDLRILGCAPRLPLAPMERFFPVMWLGFWVILAGTSLACWALAIVAGRLTAYTFFRFWE